MYHYYAYFFVVSNIICVCTFITKVIFDLNQSERMDEALDPS